MKALEKLTLAYLALQETAAKLQAENDAMQQSLAALQAKYKTAKEQKAFLQKDRNKWYDEYHHLVDTNEQVLTINGDKLPPNEKPATPHPVNVARLKQTDIPETPAPNPYGHLA